MKKYSILSLTVLMALGVLLSACKTSPIAGNTSGITVTVATDATFPPFAFYIEPAHELIGFDVEVMNAIAEKNGWTIEWVNAPFEDVIAGVTDCQYDLAISSRTIPDEQKTSMDFSNPYYNSGQVVVIRTNETTITTLADLKGKIISAKLGSIGETKAKTLQDVHYRGYATYDRIFQNLVGTQVDAVITNAMIAFYYVQVYPDELMVIGEQFEEELYSIAVCQERTDLIDPINSALSNLIEDGTLNQLAMKWLAVTNQ